MTKSTELSLEKLILYTIRVSKTVYNCALSNTTTHEFLSKDAFDGFIASSTKQLTISDIAQTKLSHAFYTDPPAMQSHTKFHTTGLINLGRHHSERLEDDLLCYTLPSHKELALSHIIQMNKDYLLSKKPA
jgi:hypothetical protein